MDAFFQNQQWLFIAGLVFGLLAYAAFLRRRDHKWIEDRFGGRPILAMSFGVSCFGCSSEPGPPRRSSGFLLLMPHGLFFRSRTRNIELEIPGRTIARIYTDHLHKGMDLRQSLMKIDFKNSCGERDTAAFRVPYPPQWIRAVENIRKSQSDGEPPMAVEAP